MITRHFGIPVTSPGAILRRDWGNVGEDGVETGRISAGAGPAVPVLARERTGEVP